MKNSFFSKSVKQSLLVSLLFFVAVVFAQAPTITSFTPTSGAVGSSLTITGTGFNTTASNNVVYFDGVKATITSTSATQIIVTVPSGSSGNSKIKVINLQAGATSSKSQFTTTFFSLKSIYKRNAGSIKFHLFRGDL
jgi:uncharacterized protein (TIGR03437 family)